MLNILANYATQILLVHIACGFISLLLPLCDISYVFAARQRPARIAHRIMWSLFHISMGIVGTTGILLSFATIPVNYFLFSVGLFTLYMVISASRALLGSVFRPVDVVLGGSMSVVGVAMVAYAFYGLATSTLSFAAAPLIIFGSIGCLFGIFDIRVARNTDSDAFHMRFFARNFGALIAVLTAFLVVNIDVSSIIAHIIVWVAPTALFTPMIAYISRMYAASRTRETEKKQHSISALFQRHIRSMFPLRPAGSSSTTQAHTVTDDASPAFDAQSS